MPLSYVKSRPIHPALTPEEKEANTKQVGEEYAEKLKAALLDVLDNGFLLFGKATAQQRLAGYMRGTLASELPMVTDPDCQRKIADGVYPPLQQYIGMGLNGQPVPSPWWFWAQLPDYVFSHFATDFRTLLSAQLRRA